MRYGIYLPNYGAFADVRWLAALARDAENAGWDGFFLWDHIVGEQQGGPVVDPWIALAAAALNTTRIRIGTTVTPVPRRRPHKLARETVTLDHLSGGRLTLGVGIGLGAREWDDLGEEADPRVRGAMLDEGLDVLAGLWTGEPFSYAGAHYRVQHAHFRPAPVQQPRIPVWVGGFWPHKGPMRRAARWDGVFPLFEFAGGGPPDDTAALRDAVAYVLSQRTSGAPFDVIYNGHTPTPAHTDYVRAIADAGATWWLEILYPWIYGWAGAGDWPVEAMRARVLAGPPRI
jgi:alkanesulfonate monooxygenase SsuD/methylene tetrahydromethanopterin reductase-like flavin-dependent oxidoreductase (luciferase family)